MHYSEDTEPQGQQDTVLSVVTVTLDPAGGPE